jgi:hypothetical protein
MLVPRLQMTIKKVQMGIDRKKFSFAGDNGNETSDYTGDQTGVERALPYPAIGIVSATCQIQKGQQGVADLSVI